MSLWVFSSWVVNEYFVDKLSANRVQVIVMSLSSTIATSGCNVRKADGIGTTWSGGKVEWEVWMEYHELQRYSITSKCGQTKTTFYRIWFDEICHFVHSYLVLHTWAIPYLCIEYIFLSAYVRNPHIVPACLLRGSNIHHIWLDVI